MSHQTRVARGATFIFVQGFLNAGLGVIFVWFLLNSEIIIGQQLFTEADLGIYTMLGLILTLSSTLGGLSLRNASVRYLSHYLSQHESTKARSVITRVLQVSAVTSLTVIITLFLLAGELSDMFATSILIFQIIPLCVVLQIFYVQGQGFLQGLQKIREIAIIGVFYTIVQYSVGLSFVYAGLGVLGLVCGWLTALFASCSVSYFIILRRLPPAPQAHDFKPLLVFSLPIFASALLTFLMTWVDQIILFPFRGTDALGVYNLAVRASVVPNLVSIAIVTSLFPKLSELRSTYGETSLRDAFKTSTRYAAFIGFPVSLMVATLAYPIIVLFAPSSFLTAVIPLAILCIASLPQTLGLAIIPTFYAMERTKVASLITMFTIVLQVVLTYSSLALLNLDLPSVAFSKFFSALVGFALGTYILKRSLRIEFDTETLWKSASASFIMVLSLFGVEAVRWTLNPSSYQFLILRLRQLPFYVIVGGAAYIIFLIGLNAVEKRDVELFQGYLPSRLQWIANWLSRIARIEINE